MGSETEGMVERVAKAMISAIDEKEAFVRENDGICDVTVDGHVDFAALARAAIEAMREPTDEMVRAGRAVDGQYNTVRASIDAAAHYRAMIDKALEKDMER